jgi:hypothetical protein
VSVGCAYLLLAVVASAFDDSGFFGPFTIFRPSSLTLFLALVLAVKWLEFPAERAAPLKLVALGAAMAVAAPALASDAVAPVREQRQARALTEPLYDFARTASAPAAVFMIEPGLERRLLSFERSAERALLVMNKFVPSSPDAILEWYRRRLFQNELFTDGCKRGPDYRVDYLIASSDAAETLIRTCGPVVFEHENLSVIRNESTASAPTPQAGSADVFRPSGG